MIPHLSAPARLRATVTVLVLLAVPLLEAARVPDWIQAAADRPLPAMAAEADAVVLHHFVEHAYNPRRGRPTTTARFAVKVLTAEGAASARFSLPYNDGADRVKQFEAWILPRVGKPVRIRQRDCPIINTGYGELYSDQRALIYSAAEEARPGTVFAFEYELEEHSIFAESLFSFSRNHPVLFARAQVSVPEEWVVRFAYSNDNLAVEETTRGNTWTWTAREVPPVETEDYATDYSSLVTALRFAVEPRTPTETPPLLSWSTWEALAEYSADLMEGPSAVTPEIRRKARELTAGAVSEADKVRAIGEFVQAFYYVSLTLDLQNGGGYRPYPASEVLACGYGDCKDKATLMRALLAAVEIPSYQVICLLDDHARVDLRWPSPAQFNHAIIAVALSENPGWESVVEHPALGPLLIFDPTDEYTPLGFLNGTLQNSHAYLTTRTTEPLIHLPLGNPARHAVRRDVAASIDPLGNIAGELSSTYTGSQSRLWRRTHRREASSDFNVTVANWVANDLRKATVRNVSVTEADDRSSLTLTTEFESASYARTMRGRIMVFQPALVARKEWNVPKDEERLTPLSFDPIDFSERTEISLPESFVVDELPAPVILDEDFGRFALSVHAEDGRIICERSQVWTGEDIPPERYEALRTYIDAMLKAESAPVVLVRAES